MLSESLQNALTEQIQREFGSAYLYLSMCAWCHKSHLCGFANWLYYQCQEELEHGYKIFDYLIDRGAAIVLPAIPQPEGVYDSIIQLFQAVYDHEQMITQAINGIYAMAEMEKDYATCEFLDWFICEQVKEEKDAREIHERLWMYGQDPAGLMLMDCHLGKRNKTDDSKGSESYGEPDDGGRGYNGYGWGGQKPQGSHDVDPQPFKTGS